MFVLIKDHCGRLEKWITHDPSLHGKATSTHNWQDTSGAILLKVRVCQREGLAAILDVHLRVLFAREGGHNLAILVRYSDAVDRLQHFLDLIRGANNKGRPRIDDSANILSIDRGGGHVKAIRRIKVHPCDASSVLG